MSFFVVKSFAVIQKLYLRSLNTKRLVEYVEYIDKCPLSELDIYQKTAIKAHCLVEYVEHIDKCPLSELAYIQKQLRLKHIVDNTNSIMSN